MATTADFKNGLAIEYNNDVYSLVYFQHVKPGKGGAFVRTKLKSYTTGKVVENTFTSGVKIKTARVERRGYQFLYKEGNEYHFMDTTTYDQISIPEKKIESPQFLKEGQEIDVLFHQEKGEVLACELPPFVILKVEYTEPGFKGDTANKTLKPAKLETGFEIGVPLFINNNDKIKIDTRTGQYVERIKY